MEGLTQCSLLPGKGNFASHVIIIFKIDIYLFRRRSEEQLTRLYHQAKVTRERLFLLDKYLLFGGLIKINNFAILQS